MQDDHAPPRAGAQALAGTVVYIVRWRADGDISFQGPLARKVASHGARVVQRLTKDVTHVLLQLKPLPSPSERALEQDKLRELYAKVDKCHAVPLPHVVTPLWVQDTIQQGRRAQESMYVIERPQQPMFLCAVKQGPTKPSSAAVASARRVSALLQPPEPLDIDLEADIFSSSQQLKSGLDVNPSAAYKKGASGAGAAGRGAGASAKGTAAVRGNGGGGGGSKQQASTGAKQAKAKPASGLARWVGSVAAAISAVVKPAAVQGMATGAALGAPGLNTGKAAAYTAPVRGQQKPAVAGSASALVSPTRRPLQPSQGQASGQAGTFAGGRTAATGLAGENADAAAATARGHVAASPGIGLRGAASTSGVSAARSGGTLAALRTRTSPAPAVKALVVSPTAQRWLPAPHTGLTATPAGASRFSAQAGATAVTSPSAGTRSAAKRSRLDVAAEDSGAAAAAKGSRSPMRGSFSFHVPVSAASQLASPTLSGSKAEAQGLRPSPLPRQRSGTTATTAAAVHAAVPVGMQAGPVVRTAAGSAACPPPPIFEGSRLFCGQAQGAAGVRQESSTASEATAARVSKLKRPRQDMPGEGGGAAVVEPRGATSGAAAAASIPAATADPAADPAAADPAAAGTAQGGRSSMTRAGLSASLLQQAMSVATTLTPSAAGVRSSGKGQGGKPSASAHRRKSSLTPGVIAAAAAAAGTPADLQAAPVGRTPCATPKLAAAPKAAAPVPAAATGLLSKGAGGGGAIRVPKLKGGTSGTVTPAATCGAEGGSTPQLLAMAAAKLAQQAPSEAGAGLTPKLGGNAAGAAHRQPQAELAGGVATASATPLEGAGTAGGAFGSAFATPFSVIDLTGPSQDVPASVLNAAAAGVALVATETAVPEAARTRAGSRAGGSAAAAVPTADTQSTRPQQEKMPPEQQQQQLRQLVNVPAPSPSRQRHRTPDGKVRDAEHHGTGPAKVARMAAASAPTGQSPVLTAPEAPASPSSPQAGNAGPAPSGAAPAPSCSLLRGTPGSILRTASRVPPGSQIVGTPMTTPHHFTRQQKEKYSRMGLDLDAMPRCREFVVQDDGTVFVADEPGRGAAQPGPEVEGEACSRRQEAQLEAQPQGVATDAAAGAVHVAAMTLSGKAAAADILPGAAGSSGPAEEQRRRGRKRPAAEAGLDAEGQHHAMTGGLGQGTELAQREAADEDARLAGTSAAESQQGTAADDGGEHASRGPACTGERQGDATLAVDDTGAEAAPKKRRRIEAKAEQGGEAQTTAAAATAVQPSTSGSAIQALKAAGRKGAQGVSIAKQARPTKQAKPVKGSAKGSMAAASGGFRQTTLSPFLRMNGTAAAITASAAAGPVAPSCQETATGQQQVKRQPAGAKVVAAAGPVEANANANGSSAASQPSQSMGNKAGAGAAGPSAQDREASQSQGRDQLPAGSRYRYYLACTALDPDCAESTRVALKAATKQLGDAKVCVDGYEGGLVTHMLVGSETRTFKMLLAVANGAWLLQPQWLHDSLAAGCWQAEEAYKLQSRFTQVADKVRSRLAQPQPPPRLLEGRQISIHYVTGAAESAAGRKASDYKEGLQKLVVALGGRVVPPRCCDICVVAGSAPAPRNLGPSTKVVHEDWLKTMAEQQEPLGLEQYLV